MAEPTRNPDHDVRALSFLPKIDSPKYHLLLGCVAIFILGPLGGISAAYMNFSIGFFVGGQVLAGILGSVVTYGYGAEGKHGANYMQTMAASVASMSAMGVLIQASVWMGLKEPPAWQLILFFTSAGMFGVGVGMLYTPILVDRMQLVFPSGYAVANILRALTDKRLLKQSILRLGGGTVAGLVGGVWDLLFDVFARIIRAVGGAGSAPALDAVKNRLAAMDFSASTLGAGMIVGARISIPVFLVAWTGRELTPWMRGKGWLGPHDPFRKIGFLVALGTILGAAIVDLTIIGFQAAARLREKSKAAPETDDWKKTNTRGLIIWVVFWAAAVAATAIFLMGQPAGFVLFAIGLVMILLLVNGISQGISDSNPISSAFVTTVLLMSAAGLKDPGTGLISAGILFIACTVGVDMQQDRSTGWRLGTSRVMQFRYQVVGIVMGSVLAVVLAKFFMRAYPMLQINAYDHPDMTAASKWQSAMTFKIVGVLEGLTHKNPIALNALLIGLVAGLVIELLRKLIKRNAGYKRFVASGKAGYATDFMLDAIILSSPYASSFGGFINFAAAVWFGLGGVVGSCMDELAARRKRGDAHPTEGEVPADMSSPSLIGGGLIAGDSLAALGLGIYGLLTQLL
jgi:uncharacterized oligopeptide transporter (OPT) family protein